MPVMLEGYQQGQLTPMSNGQMSPMDNQQALRMPTDNAWSQADLMATLMPEAMCLDKEQIAEQLRAAAPCSYDD
jgi:hypothetical protein